MVKKAIDNNGKHVEVSDDTVVENRNGVNYLLTKKQQQEYDQNLKGHLSKTRAYKVDSLEKEKIKRLSKEIPSYEQQMDLVAVLEEIIRSGKVPNSIHIDKMRTNNKALKQLIDKSKKIEKEISNMELQELDSFNVSNDKYWT